MNPRCYESMAFVCFLFEQAIWMIENNDLVIEYTCLADQLSVKQ